jgi:phosphate starvation-inducible PhoH-like protein
MCGDIEQCDLFRNKYDTSGFPQFMKILDGMDCFEFVEFQAEDIVRSGLVKEYILQKRTLNNSTPIMEKASAA